MTEHNNPPTTKPHWGFRTNWRGKLILQRLWVWDDDGYERREWRDADIGDIVDFAEYYKEVA